MSALSFKDSYKKDNENIKPRKDTLLILSEEMKRRSGSNKKTNKYNYKIGASVVAALLIFSVLIFAKEKLEYNNKLAKDILEDIGENQTQDNEGSDIEENENNNIAKEEVPVKEGIYVPKQQLGIINPNRQAYRIGTLVYKGRVYTAEGTEISLEEGKALMNKRLGITWDLIEKIRDDGTSEVYIDLENLENFASFGNGEEVYTVKGYDDDFRLITYNKNEYGDFILIWECLNDFILADGSDVFGKMNINENVNNVTWETFNNWNYGTLEEKEVIIDDTLNGFIDAMYNGIPYSLEDEEFRKELFDKESNYNTGEEYFAANEEAQKFMFFKMNDGTKVEIRLFRSGYVYYRGLNFAFKLDEESFDNMWSRLN